MPNDETAAVIYATGLGRNAVKTIQSQVERCRDLADEEGKTVTREIREVGTGNAIGPKLASLIAEAHQHGCTAFSTLIVDDFRCFGRTVAAIRSVVSDLHESLIEVLSVTNGDLVFSPDPTWPVTVRGALLLPLDEAQRLASAAGAMAAARIRVESPEEYAAMLRQVLTEGLDHSMPLGRYATERGVEFPLPQPEEHLMRALIELCGESGDMLDIFHWFWGGFREEVAAVAVLEAAQ